MLNNQTKVKSMHLHSQSTYDSTAQLLRTNKTSNLLHIQKAKQNISRGPKHSLAQLKLTPQNSILKSFQRQSKIAPKSMGSPTMQLSVIQKADPPGTIDGMHKGFLDSTFNRFQLPKMTMGSPFAFNLMASALITPLLKDAPSIPSEYKPYIAGYSGGFLSGTAARKFVLGKMGIHPLVDTVMTLSNINSVAVRLDEELAKKPALISPARRFIDEVGERANEQHYRTNPYMTPHKPKSIYEIQSNY
ncbi:hypothetical protein [uncultured Shewanella sp.]|uniref:hypothetical protein n=1 Tax=uncultured Shewanella sp. TaxID=173975 RepID=UPI00262B618C|nr:hypothetical protein [uncultured Shewanella sp.]